MAAQDTLDTSDIEQIDFQERFIFSCKDDKVLIGDVAAVSASSRILRTLIQQAFTEGNDYLYTDFNGDTVNNYFQFLETENVQLDSFENKKDLYKFSRQYEISNLEDLCRKQLNEAAREDNICSLHDLACEMNDRLLQFFCWKKFDEFSSSIFETQDFLNCSKTTIIRIVSRPISTVAREVDLFIAVYNWANRRKEEAFNFDSDIRFYLDEFLPYFKYITMSEEERNILFSYNVLNQLEVQCIQCYYSNRQINLPRSLFREDIHPHFRLPRSQDYYHCLFNYVNEHSFGIKKERNLRDVSVFINEFTTTADCFVTGLRLPLTEFNGSVGVIIDIDMRTDCDIPTQTALCYSGGKITIDRPVFIPKPVQPIKITTRIPEEDIISNYNIRVPIGSKFSVSDGEYQNEKIFRVCRNFFAEVKLWF